MISLAAILRLFYVHAYSELVHSVLDTYILNEGGLSLCSRSQSFMASTADGVAVFPTLTKEEVKGKECHPESDIDDSQAKKNKSSKDFISPMHGNEGDHTREATRCTQRSGAGSGGQVSQLEKIRMVLEKPTAWPQKVMDIAEDLPDNLLAPLKKQKHRKAKVSLWQACMQILLIFLIVK